MSYPYEDLDDHQFERLVVQCARKLFGPGVQSFADGKDGGRDARFDGTAERFPSSTAPWQGITVIQAKHTIAINASFADANFSNNTPSAVLSLEIERIKKLVEAGEVDNYMLFSNRRLGGVISPKITTRIADETGIARDKVFLAGIEYMNDLLHEHRGLLQLARISPLEGPLVVSSYDLADMMLAISEQLRSPLPEFDAPVVDRVSYEKKNALNNMSEAFAERLASKYMVYTQKISDFLSRPENSDSLKYYEAAVDDFQDKIVAHRSDYHEFDKVFNRLVDLLRTRSSVLARDTKLLKAIIFYMYWNCDIGETSDAYAS